MAEHIWAGGRFVDRLQSLAGALCTGDAKAQARAASAVLNAVPFSMSTAEFTTARAVLIAFVARIATRTALPPFRLARALRNCEESDAGSFRLAVQHCFDEIGCSPAPGETDGDPRVAAALRYIELCSPSRRVSVDQIAKQVGVSRWHLERLMRRWTGRPLTAHLRDSRMAAATRLLETTFLEVKEIAAETGYGSASAFARDFKRTCGATPARWRRTAVRHRGSVGGLPTSRAAP